MGIDVAVGVAKGEMVEGEEAESEGVDRPPCCFTREGELAGEGELENGWLGVAEVEGEGVDVR